MKTKKCDHIVKIAEENKYYKWKTVWDGNKELQNSRGRNNPLVLFTGDGQWEGDEIVLPAKGPPPFKQPIDKMGVYKVPKVVKLCLRLRILKADFSPAKDASFELIVKGGETYKGKTDDKGFVKKDGIDPEIPKTCTEAALSIRIKAAGGDDNKELKSDDQVNWKLQIGRLNPLMEKAHTNYCISGVQQRLNNLGFYSGPVDGRKGPNTMLAIEKFQSLFGLKVDNIPGTGETQPRLQEVHDSDKPVTVPEGDKKATKTIVAENRFRATTTDDIGHVAPDFVDSDEPFINTFVLKPEYRIKLDLGKIEDLFLNKPDSDKGRMERLQVLGLFYFPLNHKMAQTAFEGIAGPPKAKGAWEYFKTEILKNADNAAADKEIQKRLEEWVVQKFDGTKDGSIYNVNGKSKGGGELPEPGPEDDTGKVTADEKKFHYAKIRVPGGFTYIHKKSWSYIYQPNHDNKYPMNMTTDNLRKVQDMCYHDNPVLGAIPLIATVEQYKSGTDEWVAAPDVPVYFQLVEPYKLPDHDADRDPDKQLNRPTLRPSNQQTNTNTGTGPAKQDAKVATDNPAAANDPQVDNCPSTFGGKRGTEVAGNVFELKVDLANHKKLTKTPAEHDEKVRPGFYAAHTGDRADAVEEPFFVEPEKATGAHTHAIKSKSNIKGLAGLIFKPSPTGGDRYRIRAFVDPPVKEGTGTDEADKPKAMVETGTFIVWRNIRISKIIRLPVSKADNSIDARITGQITLNWPWLNPGQYSLFDAPEPNLKFTSGLTRHKSKTLNKDKAGDAGEDEFVGYSNVTDALEGKDTHVYDSYIKDMARAFCEVVLDPKMLHDVTKKPWLVTNDEWWAAINFVRAHVKQGTNKNVTLDGGTVQVNIDKLFILDAPKIDVTKSFVLLPVRLPKDYNDEVGLGSNAALPVAGNNCFKKVGATTDKDRFDAWFDDRIVYPLLQSIMHHGFRPGLSMLQMPTISTMHAAGVLGDYSIGLGSRCCVMHGGSDNFPATAFQKLDATDAADGTITWGAKKKTLKRKGTTKIWLSDFSYGGLLLHEWGHCLYHEHSMPHPVEDEPGNAAEKPKHDKYSDGFCVMSYLPCEGQFCARCLFVLRGWNNISGLPNP